MKRVLIVAPTRRDLLNLADGRILPRYDLVFEERPGLDGVFGSSDSTAALAVVVADRLRLPGPGYEAFMRCHDKLASRRIQATAEGAGAVGSGSGSASASTSGPSSPTTNSSYHT